VSGARRISRLAGNMHSLFLVHLQEHVMIINAVLPIFPLCLSQSTLLLRDRHDETPFVVRQASTDDKIIGMIMLIVRYLVVLG
jgi:hypothetical protein